MVKPTREQLVAALRSTQIGNSWQPGMPSGDKATGHFCRLCESEWKAGRRERHKPDCILEGTAKGKK